MEVILTVEAEGGATDHVSASAATYDEALAAAKAKVPDGSTAIVIRVKE